MCKVGSSLADRNTCTLYASFRARQALLGNSAIKRISIPNYPSRGRKSGPCANANFDSMENPRGILKVTVFPVLGKGRMG